MTTILATDQSLKHGDGFLRKLKWKQKTVIHNTSNYIIKVKLKSKVYDHIDQIKINQFSFCMVKKRHYEDFPEQEMIIAPNSKYKFRLSSDQAFVTIFIDDIQIFKDIHILCSHDLIIDNDFINTVLKNDT